MTEKSLDQTQMSPITDVLARLQATSGWQEHVYKQLHAHPELSFQETETAALAASKLKELGYEVHEGIGRTGVVGILRNCSPRRVGRGAGHSSRCGCGSDVSGEVRFAP